MRIRIPIRDGITLILDEHGLELEADSGRSRATWPLNIEQILTLRDGCDAAFKLEQCKMRKAAEK